MGDRKVKEPSKVNFSLPALLFHGPWADCEHGRTLGTTTAQWGPVDSKKMYYFCTSLPNLNNNKLKQ